MDNDISIFQQQMDTISLNGSLLDKETTMEGIYDQIINQLFRAKIEACDKEAFYIGEKKIGRSEAVVNLTSYLSNIVRDVIKAEAIDEAGVERCMGFINSVIKCLGSSFNMQDIGDNLIDAKASILTAVVDKAKCDYPDIEEYVRRITPTLSLTSSSLFTGSRNSVDMISELKKEILSANKIDILVSFIRKSGLNMLLNELKESTSRGTRLRIITTTYMQCTEYDAIHALTQLPNTEIKISYNTEVTRLHAKAYIFFRTSGFHTAYIGSSNMSRAALTEGLEWNVKATQVELPHILAQVRNTFETYWQDASFESYNEAEDSEKLKQALGMVEGTHTPIDYDFLDLIRAKDYQEEVLEKLDIEREYYNHHRNLVVAATGTGKTVIAAFDYKRFREQHPRANFLFVVHREEIIRQACEKFRKVLEDENFGEVWYGGHETTDYSHVFASKDLLNSRIDDLPLPSDYYDYIIVDEAHHIVAPSYQKILAKFKPKILLGLTATPERMDLQDITTYFDGKISAEIRLDSALNNKLLAPFHYYGITDCVDLANVKWERGHFVASELSKIYTANDYRTKIIFDALQKYLPNYSDVRALCFCVNIEHAEMMHAKFTLANLRSAVITSDTPGNVRSSIIREFTNKEINYLFVVDIFNEGVDIPYIDTVLFLRPTESLTIFLQQFGRGLRKAPGKEFLTVLDFVGHSRAEFNYMDRFRALMGRTSMGVKEEIERDFPHLPFGCQIQLEPKAKEYILENIRGFIRRFQASRIIELMARFETDTEKELTLSNFIQFTQIPLDKIYKNRTWNQLCLQAGVSSEESEWNTELARAVSKKWLSTDSFSYFSFINKLATEHFNVDVEGMNAIDRQYLLMLYYDLFNEAGHFETLQEMTDTLSRDTVFCNEVKEVTDILKQRCEALEMEDNSSLMIFPLKLHGVYTKAQIQVALQTSTLQRKSPSREGCERTVVNGVKVEAMYVDIIKNREEGSTTNYNDFAMSNNLFHWESQSTVGANSKLGQNYIRQTQKMLLFVRKQNVASEDSSRTLGYVYLGEVTLVSYEGNRPMQIIWKLKTPMPASVCEYARKYAI